MNNFKFKIVKSKEPIIDMMFDITQPIEVVNGTFSDLDGDVWTSWTFDGLKIHMQDIYDTDIKLVV